MGDSRSPGRKRGKSPLDASGLHLAGWRCCLLLAPSLEQRRKEEKPHKGTGVRPQPAQSRKAVVGAGGAAGETGRVGGPGKATAHAATGTQPGRGDVSA